MEPIAEYILEEMSFWIFVFGFFIGVKGHMCQSLLENDLKLHSLDFASTHSFPLPKRIFGRECTTIHHDWLSHNFAAIS